MKDNKKNVVVFDLDDTLYNEIDFLKSGFIHISKILDENNFIELYIKMFSQYRNGINVFEKLSCDYNVSIDFLIKQYRYHIPNLQLNSSVMATIKELKKNDITLSIITDGRSKTQNNKIKSLGLDHYIDDILISEELGCEKPNAKAFCLLQDKYPGSTYWYVGDNMNKDFIAPKTLGWNTIKIIDKGLNIHPNEKNNIVRMIDVDYFIFGIHEILKLILKIN